MQAEKQGGRGKGEGGKGQAGANLAKRRKRKKPWRVGGGVFISRGVLRQGSFALLARLPLLAPYAPFPLPLPPCFYGCILFAFCSHYGFSSPLHSAFIPLSFPYPAFLGRGVGRSGRVSGRGVGSGCRVGSPLRLAPCPAERHSPSPSPFPPPLPGGGKFLRPPRFRSVGAYQSSDLRRRSARIKLFRYRPLLGKVLNQYSFSWSSLKDIIF